MKSMVVIIFIVSGLPQVTRAQNTKSTETVNQVWLGVFNQSRFSDKWGTWTDLQLRTREEFFNSFSLSLVGVGITYYFNDVTKFTAGFSYINIYPAEGHRQITRPEHRPWQQLQWHTNYGKKRMMQLFRLEERYRRKILNDSTLSEGNNFNFRVRYNIFYDIPLGAKGVVPNSFSVVVGNEIHINLGREVVNNYFDQNRFFAGIKYQVGSHNNIQLGYMNVFQQLSSGNHYKSLNIARLIYNHNLDFRHTSSQKQ